MRARTFLTIATTVTCIAVSSATDIDTIVSTKIQLGEALATKAGALIRTKQNLILGGTKAVLSAKQRFFKEQLPHFIIFKTEKINTLLKLKKSLLSTTAAHLGQIHYTSGGGAEGAIVAPVHEVIVEEEPLLSPPAPPAEAQFSPPAPSPEVQSSPVDTIKPLKEPAPSYGPPPRPYVMYGPPPKPIVTQVSFGPPPRLPQVVYGPPPSKLRPSTEPHGTYGPPQIRMTPSAYGAPLEQSQQNPSTRSVNKL